GRTRAGGNGCSGGEPTRGLIIRTINQRCEALRPTGAPRAFPCSSHPATSVGPRWRPGRLHAVPPKRRAAVNTPALQTLREVGRRVIVATAFGVRVSLAPLSGAG